MENALYVIYFKDGEIFKGGDILNTKWGEIPENKEIASIDYYLPTGAKLILEGYDEYVNIVEVFHNLICGCYGTEITNAYMIGCKNGECVSYRITLKSGDGGERFKLGDITVRHGPKDKIYCGSPVSGWKGLSK